MSRNLILTLAIGATIAFAFTPTASITAAPRDTDTSATTIKADFKVAQAKKGKGCPKGTRWGGPREGRCVPTG